MLGELGVAVEREVGAGNVLDENDFPDQ